MWNPFPRQTKPGKRNDWNGPASLLHSWHWVLFESVFVHSSLYLNICLYLCICEFVFGKSTVQRGRETMPMLDGGHHLETKVLLQCTSTPDDKIFCLCLYLCLRFYPPARDQCACTLYKHPLLDKTTIWMTRNITISAPIFSDNVNIIAAALTFHLAI